MTITFTGAMPSPVAAQIGSGSYTLQSLNGKTLTLSIPNGTSNFAIAYLCPGPEETVWEGSIADGTSFSLACSSQTGSTSTMTGSLDASAIPGAQFFEVDAQNANSSLSQGVSGGPTESFGWPFPAGNDRVLVLAFSSAYDGPLAAKNFDNQAVPGALNGGNTVVLTAADETVSQALTYNNVPSGYSSPSTYVEFEMGSGPGVFPLASEATTQYPALPAGATESGDVYYLLARAYGNASGSPIVFSATTTSSGPVSFNFPAPWVYAGPTPAALPVFNMSYSGFSGKTGVVQNAYFDWAASSGPSSSTIGVSATANYQGSSTTLTVPDLSNLKGFLAAPASGTLVRWSANVLQYSSGFPGGAALNSTWVGVGNNGTYTVP